MSNNDITYASIVPLIGGENLGVMKAMEGQLPEWILSYKDFKANDDHLVNYLRTQKNWDGEYAFLDEDSSKRKTVDIVNTTCPCAGLSSLSTTSGADSEVNEWMYRTAEYVLSEVRPEVFWGENAPRLFSKVGDKVAQRLHDIGKKNGYSLNLYYTESRLHGIAQKRPRTFYFFTKGAEETPIFRYIRRPMEPVEDILSHDIADDDPMNVLINSDDPMDNPWLRFCMHKNDCETIEDYYNVIEKTTNCIVESDRLVQNLNEAADWMESMSFPEKFSKRARAMQEKLDQGRGYWAHGITVPKGQIPSFIGAMPHYLVNPFQGRFLTLREGLRIMKIPDDFNMVGSSPQSPANANHICQNVPVTTAADMAQFVLEYLRGETDRVNGSFVKQSNAKMSHTVVSREESTLDEFISLHR
jgi:site-specific DNA-cytosine methylase